MEKPISLSIIVPVYNVEECLDRCIESLLRQDVRAFEIILVDDGSTDGSGKLCDEWALRNEKIKVVHKENGGLSSARNAGIEEARGDYLGFVDSDDYVEPAMYSTMLEAADRTGKDIVSCGRFVHISEKWIKTEYSRAEEAEYDRESAIRKILLQGDVDVAAWDKIFRRYLFFGIRYPFGRISEDAAVIVDIVGISNGLVHVGAPLYHYVYRKGSISKAMYSHAQFDAYTNCAHIRQVVEDLGMPLEDEVAAYTCSVATALLQAISFAKHSDDELRRDRSVLRKAQRKSLSAYLLYSEVSKKAKIRAVCAALGVLPLFNALNSVRQKRKTAGL